MIPTDQLQTEKTVSSPEGGRIKTAKYPMNSYTDKGDKTAKGKRKISKTECLHRTYIGNSIFHVMEPKVHIHSQHNKGVYKI